MDYKTIANDGIVEEEIKKFHPSLEIEEAENAIYNNNISDITDVMIQMVEELKGENK